jgi:hypothetical protein
MEVLIYRHDQSGEWCSDEQGADSGWAAWGSLPLEHLLSYYRHRARVIEIILDDGARCRVAYQ